MLLFENAKESFASASGTFDRYNLECEFYHQFARMIPDRIDVDSLVLAFKIALQDAERRGDNTLSFIALIPQYVRQCTSKEFASEFRRKYNREVLGLSQEELPDVDYGYNEVAEEVLDISDKDKYEVLAALYNASTPVGMGFSEYNPLSWNKEFAQMYYEQFGEPDDEGNVRFKYILGRPVHVTFKGNLLYVAAYNYDTEDGLAQRAVSTCANKGVTLNKKQ